MRRAGLTEKASLSKDLNEERYLPAGAKEGAAKQRGPRVRRPPAGVTPGIPGLQGVGGGRGTRARSGRPSGAEL